VVEAPQEHEPDGGVAVGVGGGQGDGLGLVDPNGDRVVPPHLALGHRVRIEVVPVEPLGHVLLTDVLEVAHAPSLAAAVQTPKSSCRVGATLAGTGAVGWAPLP